MTHYLPLTQNETKYDKVTLKLILELLIENDNIFYLRMTKMIILPLKPLEKIEIFTL